MAKPFWASKRWTAILLVLAALVVLYLLGAPVEVTGPLAMGVGAALPAFIGAESWVDRARVRRGEDAPRGPAP